MVLVSAQERARPERKDGGHPPCATPRHSGCECDTKVTNVEKDKVTKDQNHQVKVKSNPATVSVK